MKRATSAIALALGVVLTVSACGAFRDDTSGPTAVSGTVTWWDTANESEEPVFKELVAAFESEYRNVDVKRRSVPFSEAQQRYSDAARGGDAPDVLRADVGWVTGLAERGWLADLSDTPAVRDKDDFLSHTTGASFQGARVYGVPQVTDTLALMYNRKLFRAAGVRQAPSDWGELRKAALRVSAHTDARGIALNTDPYYALPFLYGERSAMVDHRSESVTVAADASVQGAATAAELVTSGAALRPPADGTAYAAMQDAFKNGEVAMMINGPWSTADTFSGSAFRERENLGIAPIPAGSTGSAGAPAGGHSLVVSEDAQDPEAAQHFVRFMTETGQQERVAKKLGLLPTRKSAYSEQVLADPVRSAFHLALTKAKPRRPLPRSAAMFTAFEPSWEAILRGETSPRAGLRDTAREWRRERLLPGYHFPG
ncbi:extracellular solute-binding protein [Streptomyces oceani]|uniref:Sugar ABC transporter substrate-binding protein n=1 Tax=Streptomyces oceani TaxID=1075402 RepID=A0A1E7KEZ1_9ACTN|nr:extracellular solute-binding protein [Streptomyces oceani]OEV02454.1 hypothetical protein AN216_16375 [Streptomyces oceani]